MANYDLESRPSNHKKYLCVSIGIAITGVVVLIAGAVMLGIGIHKANQKSLINVPPMITQSNALSSTSAATNQAPSQSTPSTATNQAPSQSTPSVATNQAPSQSIPSVATNQAPSQSTPLPVSVSTVSQLTPLPPTPNRNWADTLIAFDVSTNELSEIEKKLADELIKNENTTEFDTIAILAYADNFEFIVWFGTLLSYSDFSKAVQSLSVQNATGSISSGMEVIAQKIRSTKPNMYLNTIFFTSTSDSTDVEKAQNSANLVQEEGSLIIVAIGNANSSNLLPLTKENESKVITILKTEESDLEEYATKIKHEFFIPPPSPATTATTSQTVCSTIKSTTIVSGQTSTTLNNNSQNPSSTTASITPTTKETTLENITTISATTIEPSTTPPPYLPCETLIIFVSDTSGGLTPTEFETQLAFISTTITENFNYPKRISYIGDADKSFNFNSYYSIDEIGNQVKGSIKSDLTYNFRKTLNIVLNYFDVDNLDLDSSKAVVLFVSDTSTLRKGTADAIKNLKDKNVKLTVVLLGDNPSSTDIEYLTNNIVLWSDLKKPKPESWTKETAMSAFGCNIIHPKFKSNYRFFGERDTITPCSSQVFFSTDVSKTLTPTQFKTQLNFVSSAIAGFSNLDRIAYGYNDTIPINFGGSLSLTDVQKIVLNTAPTNGDFNLRLSLITALRASNAVIDFKSPRVFVIFISDTSNINTITSLVRLIQKHNIELTFILMGNHALATDVASYAINTVTWSDLTQAQPSNWSASASNVYACKSIPTTTETPSIEDTTTIPNLTTQNPSSGDYTPCQTQVIFVLDDTNLQSDAILAAEKAFLSKAVSTFNYPYRLALIKGSNTIISYFNNNSIADFQNAINATQKSNSDFVLRANLLSVVLSSAFKPLNRAPQAAVVFVSNTSPSSLAGSQAYFYWLSLFNVKVTIVVYGPNAKAADIPINIGVTTISWVNPTTQTAPDNWDSIENSVYACKLAY